MVALGTTCHQCSKTQCSNASWFQTLTYVSSYHLLECHHLYMFVPQPWPCSRVIIAYHLHKNKRIQSTSCCDSILLYEDHHQPLSTKARDPTKPTKVGTLQLPKKLKMLKLEEAKLDHDKPVELIKAETGNKKPCITVTHHRVTSH